ncbi:MAG: acireductone synthase [Cyanobacteriota bacterium]|nr:acireductone synthase [Cyanobacteriota bacterium]
MQHQLAAQLSEVMASIHRRGWCDGTGGNFSCVLQRDPVRLLMAPSGVEKGAVKPEQLVVVDGHGVVCRGAGRASAETALHLTIVEETGAGAVLHTHSQAATLLSQMVGQEHHAELLLSDLEMLKGLSGIQTHATAVALPVLPNDQNLRRLSERARPLLEEAPHGLLIAGHGLYAWGETLGEAQRHLEILEFLLEQRWRRQLVDPSRLKPHQLSGCSHVLLDIEGTTCPVTFVAEVLFPYASQHLSGFLETHQTDPEVAELVEEVREAWRYDNQADASGVRFREEGSVLEYLLYLINVDRKLTPLKELQGRIWAEGYGKGELRAPLYADVPAALRRWHRDGLKLAVYSSGSIAAQQLLYRYSEGGDLRGLFSHWFDTKTGPKQEPQSYDMICQKLGTCPKNVLFISDSTAELSAAESVGMSVLLSCRSDQALLQTHDYEQITDLSLVTLSLLRDSKGKEV